MRHRLAEPFRHNGLGGGPGVRGLASEHLVEDTPRDCRGRTGRLEPGRPYSVQGLM